MRISDNGVKFICTAEGFKSSAYLCPAGVWTIGYGNTFYEDNTPVKDGDTVTKDEAMQLFRSVLKRFENAVNKRITQPLTQNQFDALVSICFNIGITGFKNSTLARVISKDPNDKDIKRCFEMWRYATVNGVKKPILLSRRKKEHKLYFDNGKSNDIYND